jgi:hypothetical protein
VCRDGNEIVGLGRGRFLGVDVGLIIAIIECLVGYNGGCAFLWAIVVLTAARCDWWLL